MHLTGTVVSEMYSLPTWFRNQSLYHLSLENDLGEVVVEVRDSASRTKESIDALLEQGDIVELRATEFEPQRYYVAAADEIYAP